MFFGGGKRGRRSPRVAPAGGFFPRTARLVKQGLLRVRSSGAGLAHGRAYSSRASRLIVWKMAYCLHLPTPPTPVPRPTDPPQHGPPLWNSGSPLDSSQHLPFYPQNVHGRGTVLHLKPRPNNLRRQLRIQYFHSLLSDDYRAYKKRGVKRRRKGNKSTRFKIDTTHRWWKETKETKKKKKKKDKKFVDPSRREEFVRYPLIDHYRSWSNLQRVRVIAYGP